VNGTVSNGPARLMSVFEISALAVSSILPPPPSPTTTLHSTIRGACPAPATMFDKSTPPTSESGSSGVVSIEVGPVVDMYTLSITSKPCFLLI
jgi:hypothetical protein